LSLDIVRQVARFKLPAFSDEDIAQLAGKHLAEQGIFRDTKLRRGVALAD
jgi:hypothetical protein